MRKNNLRIHWNQRSCASLLVILLLTSWQCVATVDEGVALFTKGDFAGSVTALESHLALEASDIDARFLLAVAYQKLARHEQAVGELTSVLKSEPGYLDALLPLGISAFESQQFALAENALTRSIDYEPGDASAWMFLGLTETSLGKHSSAIKSFEQAQTLDSEFKQSALLNIGLAQQQIGQRRASREALRAAVNVNPDSEVAATARGLLGEDSEGISANRAWSLSARRI